MSKTHPISIGCETHGLAGNLVLPDGASAEAQVPGVVILGGPGPAPLQRYAENGVKQWPVLWSESLGSAGIGALCYDQRGSGLSTGTYHDADWQALYDDARAATEMLSVQPEINRIAAIAWADGCAFALQLAAEGILDALVLLAPAYHTAEERYAAQIARLARQRGLSDRVVQLRIEQWQREVMATAERVRQGETTATTEIGGQTVTTNLVRFLQTTAFDPAPVVAQIEVPVLLLHGEADTVVPPAESEAMAQALGKKADRITYRNEAHFLYRHIRAMKDAGAWLQQVLSTKHPDSIR